MCSSDVPVGHDDPDKQIGPPSGRTRSSFGAVATSQEVVNTKAFLLRALLLFPGAASTSNQSAPMAGSIPAFAYATSYNHSLFTETNVGAAQIPIPKGMRQAMSSEHASYWLDAIYKEYSSILSHDVFTVVRRATLEPGTNVMRCHNIFSCKQNADGSIERFKCRLVAGGDTQKEGIDFQAIFATVVLMSTLRMALHIAAVRDYNITQIDVSTAFLYGDIDVVAYMMMPEGLPRCLLCFFVTAYPVMVAALMWDLLVPLITIKVINCTSGAVLCGIYTVFTLGTIKVSTWLPDRELNPGLEIKLPTRHTVKMLASISGSSRS